MCYMSTFVLHFINVPISHVLVYRRSVEKRYFFVCHYTHICLTHQLSLAHTSSHSHIPALTRTYQPSLAHTSPHSHIPALTRTYQPSLQHTSSHSHTHTHYHRETDIQIDGRVDRQTQTHTHTFRYDFFHSARDLRSFHLSGFLSVLFN